MNPKTNQDFENDPPSKMAAAPTQTLRTAMYKRYINSIIKHTQPPLTDNKRPAPKMIFIFPYLLDFSYDRI